MLAQDNRHRALSSQVIHRIMLNVIGQMNNKALAKRLDFSLDFLLNKKSRKKSSRLATLLSESSGVE